MLIAMNDDNPSLPISASPEADDDDDFDREEAKEDEYALIDPALDENGLKNKHYHLVDAEDLEDSQQKNKDKDDDVIDPYEEEDLDTENLLEDLKESIEQEEQDLQKQKSGQK